jgi:hypothetical protein
MSFSIISLLKRNGLLAFNLSVIYYDAHYHLAWPLPSYGRMSYGMRHVSMACRHVGVVSCQLSRSF